MIAERVAGMPLIDFLRQRVFTPLQMTSVFDVDAAPLPADDPSRYLLEQDPTRVELRDAGREARAVHGCGGGVT
jgi:CubicO group peptidase (beta-lactamase class C family)